MKKAIEANHDSMFVQHLNEVNIKINFKIIHLKFFIIF